jgi:hypothetical protein
VCTLAYAPPEQFGGGPASPSGDVYADTATFYECLTGHPPFSGDSAERLLYQHLAEPVPLEPVPGPLRPLIEAGMAKDPGRRPADATILVAELRTVAAEAYGPDWEERGRSLLGEAALLLAVLWPSGAPPAAQGTAVHRISLRRHIRPRHISPVKAAVAAGVAVAVVAAVVATHTRSAGPAAASQAGCTGITVHTMTNGEAIKTGGDWLVVDNNENPVIDPWAEVIVGSTHYWISNLAQNTLPVSLQLSSTYSPPNPYGLRTGTPVTFPAGPVTFTVCN